MSVLVIRSNDGRLAATGDDFGKVKLYAYPVTQPKVFTIFLLSI